MYTLYSIWIEYTTIIPIYTAIFHLNIYSPILLHLHGVATISRLLKITGLSCKRALYKRLYSAKETYNFKEPTNRSHPICRYRRVAPAKQHLTKYVSKQKKKSIARARVLFPLPHLPLQGTHRTLRIRCVCGRGRGSAHARLICTQSFLCMSKVYIMRRVHIIFSFVQE